MTDLEFNMIYDRMCSTPGWYIADKDQTMALIYSKFKHMPKKEFGEIVDYLIRTKDKMPSLFQIYEIEKYLKGEVQKVDCVACGRTGLVDMIHVYGDGRAKGPTKIVVWTRSIWNQLKTNNMVYIYAYACLCGNGKRYGNKSISKQAFVSLCKKQ